MGQVLHGSATTTYAVRAAIQRSQASAKELSETYGVNPKTVLKWRKRATVEDRKTGPKEPRSTVLSTEEEAMIVAFRRHTLLPLDDCLYALQPTIPHLTRSSLHRCLQRHGISRLPDVGGDKPAKKKFKRYPIGYFHIDLAEVQTAEGKLHLYVAIDRTSKFAFAQLVEKANRRTASAFLEALIAAVPYRIHTVLTDNHCPAGDLHRKSAERGHPVHPTAQISEWPDCELRNPYVRHALSGERDRTPADQSASPLDQRTGRADEPNDQRRDGETLPL